MRDLDFKVTIEYTCKNMIDEESFKDAFKGNPLEAYKMISDNFNDGISNFCNDEGSVIKVELIQ